MLHVHVSTPYTWKESESEPSQSVSTLPSPQRVNPERAAKVHKDRIVAAETPAKEAGEFHRRKCKAWAHLLITS